MKKFLLALVLMVLMLVFIECGNTQPVSKEPTAVELDSIRHKFVNDSITELDTIRVLKTLFMGMNPAQYDSLKNNATQYVKIGLIEFNNIDTLIYHGTVHDIVLNGKHNQNYILDIDEMAKCMKEGEESFTKVIDVLFAKYGSPSWISRVSEVDKDGHQFGIAKWNFDKFSIYYEQHQYAYLRSKKFSINAKIKYSIPRIATEEEKHRSDSIVKSWKKGIEERERKRQDAIRSL